MPTPLHLPFYVSSVVPQCQTALCLVPPSHLHQLQQCVSQVPQRHEDHVSRYKPNTCHISLLTSSLNHTCPYLLNIPVISLPFLLQKIRSTLRSSVGPPSGFSRKKTATTAQRKSVSVRKKSCASSTPSVAGASGDTRPPLHHTSPEGAFFSGTHHCPHPKPLTLSRPQDSQLSLGRPMSVSNVYVLADGHFVWGFFAPVLLPSLLNPGLMPSLRQKPVVHKRVLRSSTGGESFSLCLVFHCVKFGGLI